ncbi:divergent PAP2 family protein [Isachenkonia alkalipeptolytica]|uniref:Divergent PAP2 family protein n=1 Tax=Isachenkonia alkalipeptolytica TaxID=2565777 RepID=A0AA44BFT0_9CLOT|nr:divergent PAP2 family protein [Isachenkonia alkalipeptolytica]
MEFVHSLFSNEYLIVAFLAWFIAQSIKVLHTLIRDRRFNLSRFVGSGGMPSSHSSFVMGLTTTIGLNHGWNSATFAVSLVFSLVVMYDAAGVRRAVGKQAIIMNKIIDDLQSKRKDKKSKDPKVKSQILTEKRLKELIGHTPVEVFAGAILGIIVANIVV